MRQATGRTRRQGGFTLVEAVVTILIAAIMAIGIVSYIGDSVEGFASAASRNQLASSGRTTVDRIALELHNALPNSLRVTAPEAGGDQCLEYIPIIRATAYIDPSFTGQGSQAFEAVNFNPELLRESPAGVYAVIYPIDTGDVYEGDNPGPGALIDEISDPDPGDGRVTITLDEPHRFSRSSPVERIYVAEEPVSFCLVDDRIYRYAGYGFHETQCTPDDADCLPANAAEGRHLVSDRIDNEGLEAFRLLSPTLRRNAIIKLDLNFTESGDTVRLNHEIAMRNLP